MAKGRTVRFEFDPFELTGESLPKGADRAAVLEASSEFVLEQVLSYVASKNSPVRGHGAFAELSPSYKQYKKKEGHPGVPDLLFSGDMLDAVRSHPKGKRVVLEVTGDQGAKADGHCNHSGESDLPLRRFIPADGETFKAPILDGLRRIIRSGGEL